MKAFYMAKITLLHLFERLFAFTLIGLLVTWTWLTLRLIATVLVTGTLDGPFFLEAARDNAVSIAVGVGLTYVVRALGDLYRRLKHRHLIGAMNSRLTGWRRYTAHATLLLFGFAWLPPLAQIKHQTFLRWQP